MINKNPIGIFDSGVGGLSIWKEIHKKLPHEDTIYLADSKNAPYGQKNKQDIIDLCVKNTEFLINKGCKLIVVACNTATTNAIQYLRENYSVSFVGIEPAIKPAALNSKTKTIGILATKGTLSSDLFHNTAELYANSSTIIEQTGTGLVELIEEGKKDSLETTELLEQYLDPMIKRNIDYLVLGCSHYPFLIPQIQKILPEHIQIIDSGKAVATQVEKSIVNKKNRPQHKASCLFYTNKDNTSISTILQEKFSVKKLDF